MRRAEARTSPARTAAAISSGVGNEVPRDDHALDFVGALADLAQLAVAQRALDGELAGVAVAAVDLDGAIAGAHRHLRRPQLGRRRLVGVALPVVAEPGGALDEQARAFELRRRIGEHELDRLVVGDGPAELLALLGVGARGVERAE